MTQMIRNFICISLAFIASSTAQASTGDVFGLSPFWNWKQIETEHFRIVFPEQVSAQAQRVAVVYEQAHADLKTDLRWEPRNLVNVLLVDNADTANGLATPISRFGMLLYLTPPDSFFSTDAYEEWLRLLIYHEYTHFLNMDATRGFFAGARYVFGDVLLPNATWPTWMLEGYAVFNETKYTRAGRGRSPYWSGILRTIVAENALDRGDYLTLDRVNGHDPYYPAGEVAYLFGYHLMNAAEKSHPGALSEMTENGSRRFPYFINGNVNNVTGKDWYGHWADWVKLTNEKMNAQLATIQSVPLSKIDPLDGTADQSLGIAFSPDNGWVAYSTQSPDHWQTLRLREWSGGEAQIIEDKFLGSQLAFTPDSKRLVYSSLHKLSNYYTWSDLRVYDLDSKDSYWLTEDARARDPDLSADGKWITYTVASDSGTDLMIASVGYQGRKLVLENPRKLVDSGMFDRVANPRFSPDGKGIAYASKTNGKTTEEIFYIDLNGGNPSALVSHASRNRFPAFGPSNTLYFVSDRSGVDNLYRRDQGVETLVTNVRGALWLPTFRGPEVYASVLSKDGFSLARVELFPAGIDPAKVSVKPGDDAPVTEKNIPAYGDVTAASTYAIEDYSALSTLAPRQWSPILLSDYNTTYIGGQVFGYDNTFRHQYLLLGAYEVTSKFMDYAVQYSNRSLGPTLAVYGSRMTADVISSRTNLGGPATFRREEEAGATLSFPFQQMVSTLTPILGASVEQNTFYSALPGGPRLTTGRGRFVPRQDLLLDYRNTRASRLAVTREHGNVTQLGVRRYDLGIDVYKGIFRHTQYFNLGKHTVLFPSVRAMKVSRRDPSYLEANALNLGKKAEILNPIYSDDFDEFGIRGYPRVLISSREAVTVSADLKFPLAQIFRGWGTNPIFVNQLAMELFAEDTFRPSAITANQHLPSVGAGLRLGLEALYVIPFTLGVDYHYGFNKNTFGQGEVFFSVLTSSLLSF